MTQNKPSSPATSVVADLALMACLFAGLSAVYWCGVLLLCGTWSFPLDDAFIHLQFARNFYRDGQMAFNPGVPSSGSTAPLYPVLLAGMYAPLGSWYLASLLLGALCSLGTAWAVYGIMRSWTGRQDLARWAGLLTIVMAPTLVQAYTGMESAAYSLTFLLGLWLYALPRGRLAASAVFALCVWLRPEFFMMPLLIAIERAVAARRSGRPLTAAAAELVPHAALWAAVAALYGFYNWSQDGNLLPTTFHVKSLASWFMRPPWLDSFASALQRRNLPCIAHGIFLWPAGVLIVSLLCLGMYSVPALLGLRWAVPCLWRDESPAAAGWRLALLSLLGYPFLRGFVDTFGLPYFQFQRYHAHLTPLLMLAVMGALPTTGAIARGWPFTWKGLPLQQQVRRMLWWAGVPSLILLVLAVLSSWNIYAMQVRMGQLVRERVQPGALVAANDIGAIGFIGEHPVLDTVGLVEPGLIRFRFAGGTLIDYLRQRRPDWLIIFPSWYPDLAGRADLLEKQAEITLPLNIICGGPTMMAYQLHWERDRGDTQLTAHEFSRRRP